jgi:HD-GYP domain-containing protein (c-di-GMP phosphodiesterase class II)
MPPSDQYLDSSAPAHSDSTADKLLRETQLLGSGLVFGAVDGAKDAGHHPWSTAAKVVGSAGAGFLIGALSHRVGFVAPVVGTALTAAFIKDVIPRAGTLGQAMSSTWDSAEGFSENKSVAKQALGQFAFDSALMSAGGIAGGALSRLPAQLAESKLLSKLYEHAPEFGYHSERVSKLSALVADEMGLSSADVIRTKHAGLGHDFGKIEIPERILEGQGKLSPADRTTINTHPLYTRDFLREVPYVRSLSDVPETAAVHHEHLDGSGYPFKVSAPDITKPARAIAIADIFDAMLGPRSYQAGKTPTEIANVLTKEAAANHIDPEAVKALLRLPAGEVYHIAEIGHQPIPKEWFLSMEGKTIGDLAATTGDAPTLLPKKTG